jgi:uncharacterized protein (PEP-CTERM system associated)
MNIKTEFLLPAMLLFSTNSQAFDWLFQPDFDANERYTDNLRMQINPSRDNFITTLSPSLLAGFVDSNQDLRTSFRWNEIIYHDDPDMDDFGEKIADFSHQFSGENFKTELKAQYAEQSSLNTQLEQDGSGNLQTQVPRFTISVSPAVTYNFTEKYALRMAYDYLNVSFDKDPDSFQNNFGFSDYENQQISATAIHYYSDRLSFNLTGAYSKFDSPTDLAQSQLLYIRTPSGLLPVEISSDTQYKQTSENITYQAGFQYLFDEQTQIAATAGMRDTKTTTDIHQSIAYSPEIPALNFISNSGNFSDTSNGSGYVFSANLIRQENWGSMTFNADQQVTPASNGNQQQSLRFSGNLKYNLSDRWVTSLDASYQETNNSVTDNNTINNRTYTTFTPNLGWRWTPEINLNLSYSYRHQQFDNLDEPQIGNNVMFQFSYQPQINRLVK